MCKVMQNSVLVVLIAIFILMGKQIAEGNSLSARQLLQCSSA